MNDSAENPRIVFAGTPAFALPALDALLEHYKVSAVYTQPDRPAGRGRQLRASPVKQRAQAADIPVYQPLSLRTFEAQSELAELNPDIMIVVAYGLLLPQAVLDLPRFGCINVHASLLPRWRGAAPIPRAILAGDEQTGISIMQMEAGLDTGPVLAQTSCPIESAMTAGDLHDQLADLGAKTMLSTLSAILAGTATVSPQDETKACYAAKLEKKEAVLDWSQSAQYLERQVRALNPWPVAQTSLILRNRRQTLKVWRAFAQGRQAHTRPGLVLREDRSVIVVATGSGELCLREIQLPGARVMAVADFINAHSLSGLTLGSE